MVAVLCVALLQIPVAAPADSAVLRHANGLVPPTIVAVRVDRPPVLDGRLDDAAWRAAVPLTDFRQSDPEEGKPVSESTEVRVVYDREALYIGARLYDRQPARIARQLGRRDASTQSDDFRVLLDSYHDHRSAFRFDVNPLGVKHDLVFGDDGNFADDSWDPVWEVATAIDSLGWTAEMRIPFSQLRFSGAPEQVWGVRFVRTILRKNEFSFWPFVGKTESGFISRFAHLLGLRDIPAPRRVELLPYVVSRGTSPAVSVAGNPFDGRAGYFGGAGLDLKYGVTSNLTLDATVNPDFGQVDVDPAFVNLTAFEQFLPERRPFFVEGASIFNFGKITSFIGFGGTPQIFYSRRIGRPPTGAYTSAATPGGFTSLPDYTTLAAAGKLTGRTGGWSVGVLDALTPVEYGTWEDTTGVHTHAAAGPLTNFFAARLKRDWAGRSGFGVMATAVDRRLVPGASTTLRSGAYFAGADFFHRWHHNDYAVSGSFSGALVRGDTIAIQATQLASSRYFNRPDAKHLSFDPTRTSLTGISADLGVSKDGGSTNWDVAASTTTPGYEVNDLGFQRRVDRISVGAFLGHRWTKPGKLFRFASLATSMGPSWNYDGDMIQNAFSASAFGQFLSFWGVNLFGNYSARVIDDRLTRGGPLAIEPAGWSGGFNAFTDNRKMVTASVFSFVSRSPAGGWSLSVSPDVSVKLSAAAALELAPNYSVGRSTAQYVAAIPDPTATATFGRRYVFGALDQHTLDVTMRFNVTMSPTLSVQLYAQPFTFAGDFTDLKELAAPRAFAFLVYGRDAGSTDSVIATDAAGRPAVYRIDPDGSGGPAAPFTLGNPDFRTRAFQVKTVLRWEYRPGSTLFLVWTESRGGFFPFDPTFDAGRDLGDLLLYRRDRPTNVLLLKVNYWLTLR